MDRRDFLKSAAAAFIVAAHPAAALPAAPPWIGIALRSTEGVPMAGERYRLTGPDGAVYDGVLDANGAARRDLVAEGTYKVEFPNFDAWDYWESDPA